ncbi:CPBP family intramembrane glutamic endopeptidase [Sphingomicrobium sp. XHP0235]|uniref:CPBP family intramembrane glutamic endopeptidase n=1 Tax=Sphingomicrobium aquimarinum TaxID=3133971 RepID=UPI0031FF4169
MKPWQATSTIVATQLGFVGFAYAIARWQDVALFEALRFAPEALAWGVAGAAAMLALVYGSRTLLPRVWVDLDKLVREVFGESGLSLGWPTILLVSASAGIGEELLFRGALQGWLASEVPLWLAIVGPALLFAVLHPFSRAYVAYAFVIGCFLGALYWWTGSLLAAVIAHALYDVVALGRLKRMMARDVRRS